MIEAQNKLGSPVRNRWTRCDLMVIDELGHVVRLDAGAEVMYQVIAGPAA